MDVREVQQLVRDNQVTKAANYHPGKRGIGYWQILTALENCYHVEQDGRPGTEDAWFALANLPNKRRLRIDFNVQTDDNGALLLVVTAYHV